MVHSELQGYAHQLARIRMLSEVRLHHQARMGCLSGVNLCFARAFPT